MNSLRFNEHEHLMKQVLLTAFNHGLIISCNKYCELAIHVLVQMTVLKGNLLLEEQTALFVSKQGDNYGQCPVLVKFKIRGSMIQLKIVCYKACTGVKVTQGIKIHNYFAATTVLQTVCIVTMSYRRCLREHCLKIVYIYNDLWL